MESEYKEIIRRLEKEIHDLSLQITELTFKCTKQTMDGEHDTLGSSETYEMKGCPEQLDIANSEIRRIRKESEERYKTQMTIYGMIATLTAEKESLQSELNLYYKEHSKDTDKLKQLKMSTKDLDAANNDLTAYKGKWFAATKDTEGANSKLKTCEVEKK